MGVDVPPFPITPISAKTLTPSDRFCSNLLHAYFCDSHFGRDLLDGVDRTSPVLYSDFDLDGFVHRMKDHRGFGYEFFAEPEFLFFPTRAKSPS
jgi:hypothetical protein